MSKIDKEKKRILSKPKDSTDSEAKWLLEKMGFREYTKGKTSGSRVRFYRESDKKMILLHKPHPKNEMDSGALDDVVNYLKGLGEL